MILFNNDKEIIFKITNGILLIWFVGALVFVCSSIIDLTIREPKYTYDEYKANNCSYLYIDSKEDKATSDEECSRLYAIYERDLNMNQNGLRSLYTSFANVLIIGGTLFFLNRRKENKKV